MNFRVKGGACWGTVGVSTGTQWASCPAAPAAPAVPRTACDGASAGLHDLLESTSRCPAVITLWF